MPSGPNVYFNLVNGAVSQAVMSQMRRPAFVIACGQISGYDDQSACCRSTNVLRLESFNSLHFRDRWDAASRQLAK
ncbi:hypothetical protein [Bradyrhizobium elkanii]|uniref:hypothetical protein n=1 Tax=Bradyrhizobium elkanii TaxID=29448 RepID=UPI003513EE49